MVKLLAGSGPEEGRDGPPVLFLRQVGEHGEQRRQSGSAGNHEDLPVRKPYSQRAGRPENTDHLPFVGMLEVFTELTAGEDPDDQLDL